MPALIGRTLSPHEAAQILEDGTEFDTIHFGIHYHAISIEPATLRGILNVDWDGKKLKDKLGSVAIRYNERDDRVHLKQAIAKGLDEPEEERSSGREI